MKITESQEPAPQVDITKIFLSLQGKYEAVFMQSVDNQIFMFRPLGRIEYKELMQDDRLDNFAKEEIICQACTLWPEDYDFENCVGGIPTALTHAILVNSYLDSIDSRVAITTHYRQEMFDIDYQVTCIIHEAFPDLNLEEIESWGVAKTAKYLARAEWVLQNLRGANIQYDPMASMQQAAEQKAPEKPKAVTEELKPNKKTSGKEKMTPEKLAELKRQFPDINWEDGANMTMDSFKGPTADVVSPALRPGT